MFLYRKSDLLSQKPHESYDILAAELKYAQKMCVF